MRIIKKMLNGLMGSLFFLTIFLNSEINLNAEKSLDEKTVIRVADPEQFGFTEINNQGEYCG